MLLLPSEDNNQSSQRPNTDLALSCDTIFVPLCRQTYTHSTRVCKGIGWLGLRSFTCRVWEELQFNNSHERSHGKSAKHLSPQAICQMIYERRQNETEQIKNNKICRVLSFVHRFSSSTLRCFCLGRPLILSWDRLQPHFIRHTINVIIFIFFYISIWIYCSFNEQFLGHLVFWTMMKMGRVQTKAHTHTKWFTLRSRGNKNEKRPFQCVDEHYKNGTDFSV